ncbi:ATP-dependent Clp protease proteolytic subunit-related protein 3, chloroplastic-like isoform X2 [Alnus glutinosa]|uniref:ATP-dependent Clp protease proteolytic subunit-related protein 3, chloroplastic-like isoform X2 n=1 Tax=Alnus glutinosa TaxID=3517 RepID=UPI002D765505|nr:ATP-dependent Clp protease proteolytic subunit-related protein 3, chloroplastic-like isoform X2 [Alnus glutinosa]
MATPAQVERLVSYNEHRPRRPPLDLPSLLLHGRNVYVGMPLVPAVSELIVAELMYLQWMDPKEPIYLYINSTGTTRDDGETVGMETEGQDPLAAFPVDSATSDNFSGRFSAALATVAPRAGARGVTLHRL